MSDLPRSVHLYEQGPREGFQFEKGPIPTARKIELVDSLSRTGLKQIQVCSFVPAKNVPGMADADEVAAGFKRHPGVRYEALSLNEKGLERARRHHEPRWHGLDRLFVDRPERDRFPAGWVGVRYPYPPLQRGHL